MNFEFTPPLFFLKITKKNTLFSVVAPVQSSFVCTPLFLLLTKSVIFFLLFSLFLTLLTRSSTPTVITWCRKFEKVHPSYSLSFIIFSHSLVFTHSYSLSFIIFFCYVKLINKIFLIYEQDKHISLVVN